MYKISKREDFSKLSCIQNGVPDVCKHFLLFVLSIVLLSV